ncbi:MAG: glycosyltransferase [Ignavibacteriales bacterium]|nr:glycosyltransferase [Ignavibacteriales bacterium]
MTRIENLKYNFKVLSGPVPIIEQIWDQGIVPLVSIKCITYNHEKYIRSAIEGFLMQKTTFPVEIWIHDDASTDNTANIIREYAEKYPQLFVPTYQIENQYMKKPKTANWIKPPARRGKYEAICEGDDQWTDPYKLQKQVDFLEANLEYSMCVHNAIVHFTDNQYIDYFFNQADQKSVITTEDLIEKWSFATASIVLRREMLDRANFFELSRKHQIYNGDLFLSILMSLQGPIKYLTDVMSVYTRDHKIIRNKSFKKPGLNYNRHFIIDKRIELLKIIDNYSKGKYAEQINRKIRQLLALRKKNSLYYTFPILRYLRPKKILFRLLDYKS